jgi:radical SAM protein with 4Fe4S-binding SPASM domain
MLLKLFVFSGLAFLFSSITLGGPSEGAFPDKLSSLVSAVNKAQQIQDLWSLDLKGLSDSERGILSAYLKKYGKNRSPFIRRQEKTLIFVYPDHRKTKVDILSVSPLKMKIGINIFQFASIARDAGADNFEIRGLTDFRTQSLAESMVNGVPPDPYFTATDSKQHAFSPSQANELLRMLETLWRVREEYSPLHVQMTNMQGIEQQNLTEMVYPSHDCLFCTNYVVVSPYGDVMPCPYFNKYELGNLLQDDLKDVWGNEKHQHFCDKQKKDEIDLCRYCSIKHYHKGFADSSNEVLWLAGKKVSRAVSTMTSTIIDEHPLYIKSAPVQEESISLTPAAKIINVVNLDSVRTL